MSELSAREQLNERRGPSPSYCEALDALADLPGPTRDILAAVDLVADLWKVDAVTVSAELSALKLAEGLATENVTIDPDSAAELADAIS